MKEKAKKYKKLRLSIVAFCLFVSFVTIIVRLYYIQVIEHSRYADYSRNQYVQKVRFNPTRGKIVDRNGTPLAITVPMKSVFASPYRLEDKKGAAALLSEELKLDSRSVLRNLEKKKNFVWVKRKISPASYRSLKGKEIPGISFLAEDKRFYPKKSFAARVIGFCGIDNQGLAGVEYYYDEILRGRPAIYIAQKDALGRISGFSGRSYNHDRFEIVLTLDANIQYIAEKIIKKTFEKYQAKSALAIVMATKTGEILAIAEQPEFNPNDFGSYPSSRYKSISVTQSYEPGSTFKIFLAAAALDSGVAKPDDKFNCENGFYRVGGKTIREANNNRFGSLSFTEVISKSSNIGSIKIATRLGKKKFHQYIRKFGFGSKTGIDLPGEAKGLIRDYKDWSGLSLPSISFGQEINVTPLQLVTALSIIGNGGLSVQPHIMKEVVRNGVVIRKYSEKKQRRIISRKAAKQTIEMMRRVVTEGSGKLAYLSGYDIAGKTGTAQKFDRKLNRYSKEKHLASFLALFPAYDPAFSVLVMVDEPSGKGWGGQVAAPPAREIIVSTARFFGIPSTMDTHYEVDWGKLRRSILPDRVEASSGEPEPGYWMKKMFALVNSTKESAL